MMTPASGQPWRTSATDCTKGVAIRPVYIWDFRPDLFSCCNFTDWPQYTMEKRLVFGALLCLVLGSATCQKAGFLGRGKPRPDKTVDPSPILKSISDRNSIRETQGGLPPPRVPITGGSIPESELRQIITEVNATIAEENLRKRNFTGRRTPIAFGPHLLTSQTARNIANIGRLFVEATRRVRERTGPRPAGRDVPVIATDIRHLLPCPFDPNIKCDATAKYRTITGVCNNLVRNPLWGSSHTPFERSTPSAYADGLNSPRAQSVLNEPLPLPRVISTTVHEASNPRTLDSRFTHITMSFGQFLVHDCGRFAPISEPNGGQLKCCADDQTPRQTPGCLPLEIPPDDPFFSKFNRSCMEMVRAMATPNLQCTFGVRQQLNQESAYVDGSTVYGSTVELANELRLFRGGLLKTTDSPDGELLLQDTDLTSPQCRSQTGRSCFKAGDQLVNQQPALMSMQTLWVREHNRIARALSKINRDWNDEKIYQEARKIVGAELQHVAYNEFLEVLIGKEVSRAFDFPAKKRGYNSDYNSDIVPQIRASFSSAIYRVGHSLIETFFSQSDRLSFRDHTLRPDVLYEARRGPSFVLRNLYSDKQQKADRLMSPHLINTLFELAPGTGIDLAATDIQRGRDFGIPSYNVFRALCGLPPARNFGTRRGGLVHHSHETARLLKKVYKHVDDIDLWTGGISEKVLRGAVIGPTLACITGRQFFLLKKGDRFFYENDDKYAKFPLNQLDEIRKTSLARIICDNTKTWEIHPQVFRYRHPISNPTVSCNRLLSVDLSQWGPRPSCIDGGWSNWTESSICLYGFVNQFRFCDNPKPSPCGRPCVGSSYGWKRCDAQPIP